MSVAKALLVNSLHVGVFDSRETSWRVQDSFRADARDECSESITSQFITCGSVRLPGDILACAR